MEIVDKNRFICKGTNLFLNEPVLANDGYIYEKEYLQYLFTKNDKVISIYTNLSIEKDFINPLEFIDRLKEFYKLYPELYSIRYGNNGTYNYRLECLKENVFLLKIETILKLDPDIEENMNRMLICIAIQKYKHKILINNSNWITKLLNNTIGIKYYKSKYFRVDNQKKCDLHSDVCDRIMMLIKYSKLYDLYSYSLNFDGSTKYNLLKQCIKYNNVGFAKYIVNGCLNFNNSIKYDLLKYAIENNTEIAKLIYEYYHGCHRPDQNFIIEAINENHFNVFTWIVDNNSYDIYSKMDSNERTIFYYACVEENDETYSCRNIEYLYKNNKNIYINELNKVKLIRLLSSNQRYIHRYKFILNIM